MTANKTGVPSAAETVDAIRDLIGQGARISLDLLEMLRPHPGSTLDRTLQSVTKQFPLGTGCSCKIPPPCWAPQPAGEVISHVCPGGKAAVRLRVTNCGVDKRVIQATANVPGVSINPGELTLGPMEWGVFTATTDLQTVSKQDAEREVLLWVHGCNDHYVRWTLREASRVTDCYQEIDIEDCPNLIHHWYDHFYCVRPCYSRVRKEG
jgi:hypothetical protein